MSEHILTPEEYFWQANLLTQNLPTLPERSPVQDTEIEEHLQLLRFETERLHSRYPSAMECYVACEPNERAYLKYILSPKYYPHWLTVQNPKKVFFDIETWRLESDNQVIRKAATSSTAPRQKQELGYAVTYDEKGQRREWEHTEPHALLKHLLQFDQIVSFNGITFDNIVLTDYLTPEEQQELYNRSFDLMYYAKSINEGVRLSRNQLAKKVLGYMTITVPRKYKHSHQIPEALRSGIPDIVEDAKHKCVGDALDVMKIYNALVNGQNGKEVERQTWQWFITEVANNIQNEHYNLMLKDFLEETKDYHVEIPFPEIHSFTSLFQNYHKQIYLDLLDIVQRHLPAAVSVGHLDFHKILNESPWLPPLLRKFFGNAIIEAAADNFKSVEPIATFTIKSQINRFFPEFTRTTDFLERDWITVESIPIVEQRRLKSADVDSPILLQITDNRTGESIVLVKNITQNLLHGEESRSLLEKAATILSLSNQNLAKVGLKSKWKKLSTDSMIELGLASEKEWKETPITNKTVREFALTRTEFIYQNIEHLLYLELKEKLEPHIQTGLKIYKDFAILDAPEVKRLKDHLWKCCYLMNYLGALTEQVLDADDENFKKALEQSRWLLDNYVQAALEENPSLVPPDAQPSTFHPLDILRIRTEEETGERRLVLDLCTSRDRMKFWRTVGRSQFPA